MIHEATLEMEWTSMQYEIKPVVMLIKSVSSSLPVLHRDAQSPDYGSKQWPPADGGMYVHQDLICQALFLPVLTLSRQ